MKDWSDLEEKYQEMREKDPASAEDFKKKMTERFQKTVQVRQLKLLLEPLKNTLLTKSFFIQASEGFKSILHVKGNHLD